MHDLTSHHPSAADAAATIRLREAVATARRRLLDVLHARADGLGSISGWTGPHRSRFDDESQALLDAGRDLDDSLATLLYALDDELDELRAHARRGLAGEAGPGLAELAQLLLDPEVVPDGFVQDGADADLTVDAAHRPGRGDRVEGLDLRDAVIIPIRPDVRVGS